MQIKYIPLFSPRWVIRKFINIRRQCMIINIILCGGNGTRLWPVSRALMPKQFVKIIDNKSLFQLTLERNSKICDKSFVVSNIEQYFLALDQVEESSTFDIKDSTFLLEPIGKNTAPAIALACMAIPKDTTVLVTPSDHLIKNEDAYKKVLQKAKDLASQDFLVTFGITPTFAETGFGYIESNGEDVLAFHEKPDFKTAKKYLETNSKLKTQNSKLYLWNSGMFMFKAGVFLNELKKHSSKIYEACEVAYKSSKKSDVIRVSYEDMINIPEDSIDYAVMEKSDKVKVIASDIDWSDVGSFDALSQEFKTDKNGNTKDENLLAINSKNNFVYSSDRLIATVGIDDLIVVDTPDALLISKKGSSQKIKDIVKELKVRESNLHHTHLTVHRPWGTYTVLEDALGYKIKKIIVKPGKRLSLQKHFKRSEHWIVVEGTALVTVGEKEILIKQNESTYIPMGELHRLENPGKVDVVLIEAQVGEYLGEDDIVRVDDDYERETE